MSLCSQDIDFGVNGPRLLAEALKENISLTSLDLSCMSSDVAIATAKPTTTSVTVAC